MKFWNEHTTLDKHDATVHVSRLDITWGMFNQSPTLMRIMMSRKLMPPSWKLTNSSGVASENTCYFHSPALAVSSVVLSLLPSNSLGGVEL